jgi:hypothetical protein
MVTARGWLSLTVGLLAVVCGAVWTVQGLGLLGGSVMTGVTFWAIVGPLVALGGVVVIVIGLRKHRRS